MSKVQCVFCDTVDLDSSDSLEVSRIDDRWVCFSCQKAYAKGKDVVLKAWRDNILATKERMAASSEEVSASAWLDLMKEGSNA